MEEKYYIGTDLKFQITVTADGFDQATDEYKVDLYCGDAYSGCSHITIPSSDIVEDDGDYFMLVETSRLKPGKLTMVLTAYVEDNDFPAGVRKEVVVQDLAVIKSVI